MTRRTERFSYLLASAAAVTVASAFMACTTNPNASDNGSKSGGPGSGDSCATPGHQGCPCTSAGATSACGTVTQRTNDYVTCQMGTSTCNGTTWGACLGNQIVSQSLSGSSLTTQGLHTLSVTGGCSDPCDPFCTQTAEGPPDVDATTLETTDAGLSIIGTVVTPDGSAPVCTGLQCNVKTNCAGGGSTTLTGHVYDPAGVRPLYNAYVYIPVDPVAPLPAFTAGASCDTCAGSGSLNAVAVAQTDSSGAFTLTGVPDSVALPLVVQVGKWRREITLPAVAACSSTAVSAANSRLPKNRTDGNGGNADMPHMAIASGLQDPFECLLLQVGIDPAEIDIPSHNPAIDYYVANGKDRYPGAGVSKLAPAHTTLVNSTATLNNYDAVMLPCEGSEDDANNAYVPNVAAYTDGGGRMFTTHFGYGWLATPNAGTAQNLSEYYGTATWVQPFQTYPPGLYDTYDPMTAYIDDSFPKGLAYAQWLQNVGASSTYRQLTVSQGRHDARAVLGASQQWMYGWSTTNDPTGVGSAAAAAEDMMMHMTFNTPVGSANQCGRVVFSDFHVSTAALTSGSGACTTNADCGFGATCSAPVEGTCSSETCLTNADCGDANLSCVGEVNGSCAPKTCANGFQCSSGNCSAGHCTCSNAGQCGSGACSGGVCTTPLSCASSATCGSARTCNGVTHGSCTKTCAASPDCGGTDQCVATKCRSSCIKDTDCPGAGASCTGGAAATCSTVSNNLFPYSCKQSPMSAQEEALEFMFFDLSACISNDKFAPPPPPPPTTYYYPATFTEQFTASCPAGQTMKWREIDWQATIPNTASIDFSAQTGADFATLTPATPLLVAHATTTTALPNFDVSYVDLSDKGGGGAFDQAVPAVPSQPVFLLTITLNPTSDKLTSPNLAAWKVRYDCVDAQ